MPAFGVKGRPLPTRGERTDISLSSADNSFDETKSAPACSRKEHVDEVHTTSKFIEAMTNPDWRRRREDNTSSTSIQSGLSTSDFNAPKQQMRLEEFSSNSFSSGHPGFGRFGSWDHIAASHWKSSHDDSESDIEPADMPADGGVERAATQPGNWGPCGVLKQRELPDHRFNGKPMSVIELVPFCAGEGPRGLTGGTDDDPFSSIAYIQRVDKDIRPIRKTPRKMPRNQQERELAAVLAATEDTPPRIHHMSSLCQLQRQPRQQQSSAGDNSAESRYAMLDERRPANPPSYYLDATQRKSKANTAKFSITETSLRSDPGPTSPQHAAFKKMLDKLQKGAQQIAKAS
ncbi:hypothetical protein QQZ08_005647 [Neonectria magnoliae]|uniref:Uncharacterized protein n=1 Tax=Neonectria magnoliae TaxID=2732573 RepID=A0ABR1I3Q8_9HYPO